MPFVSAVTAENQQEFMQQLVTALQQQQTTRPQRQPRRPGTGSGQRTRPKSGNPNAGAAWQGGACFECGSTAHKREDCPEFIRLNGLPGGYPKDHENMYSKWKKENNLPAPGTRPRRPPQRPTQTVNAVAAQPEQPKRRQDLQTLCTKTGHQS